MSTLEEIKLIAQCAASDNREAFSRLVKLHQDRLRRFLLNLTSGDVPLADDLAQETFIKAWLGVRNFKGVSGFRTWLFRIAVNEFVSHTRRSHTSETLSLDYLNNISTDIHTTIESTLDVTKAIAQLPPGEHICVLLFYLEELPIKDICKITNMPEGTVKSHLSRARQKLAVYLK